MKHLKLVLLGMVIMFSLSACSDSDSPTNDITDFKLGSFQVHADLSTEPVQFTIRHQSAPDTILWQSPANGNFVAALASETEITEERATYTFDEVINNTCDQLSLDAISQKDEQSLTVSGQLTGAGCQSGYTLTFTSISPNRLDFDLDLTNADPAIDKVILRFISSADERFFGFGEQFSILDLKGLTVPVLTQEQGIGRGLQPLTDLINAVSPGSAGDWYTTYAAAPYFITSHKRGFFLKNSEVSFFNLEDPDLVEIKLMATAMSGAILHGQQPLDLIEAYTDYAGRMPPLPDWVGQGAVIGLQGGEAQVYDKLTQLQANNCPVAAFWLQDWVGNRQTFAGTQLWWNWSVNHNQYPQWSDMVETLANDNVRVLTYLSPQLVNIDEIPELADAYDRNLYAEARDNGYFIKNEVGSIYEVVNTDFSAGLIDFTNPEAREWYKQVIKDELIGSGASGWMADYAEALPFDAVLASGSSGVVEHNNYPVEWAKVNREVLEEEGLLGEAVFFMRSGYTHSPEYSTLFWTGDQLVTWDEYDGLKSAVTGLISSGLSGYSLNYTEVGGFTTVNMSGLQYTRSKELLMRWMEVTAFTAMFRSHEGVRPEDNVQFYHDEETYAHFTRFAKVYKALDSYRKTLMDEAATKGYPLIRHLMLHYPDDPAVYEVGDQWLFGSEILVAPVMDPETTQADVFLPKGRWVHIWSGEEYGDTEQSGNVTIADAGLGYPPVFYKAGSQPGEDFVQSLKDEGLFD